MKVLLVTLLLCVASTSFASFFFDVDGCDACCYPPPPDCCELPPVPTTPPPPPPTTTTQPQCPCKADVVFIMDRTGSVTGPEFNILRDFVSDMVEDYADPDCFRTAVLAFSNRAPPAYSLGDDAATDPGEALALIDAIDPPSGQTNIGAAITGGRAQFLQNPPPDDGRCRAYVLFTDGGADGDTDTVGKALLAKEKVPDARMCVIGMLDVGANDNQTSNRIAEINQIVTTMSPNSELVDDTVNFAEDDIPDDLAQKILDCICACEDLPNVPTTPPPPPPTSSPPPPDCPNSADVVFVFDRTGSILQVELDNTIATAKGVIDLMEEEDGFDCYRVAAVQFNEKGQVVFGIDEAADADEAKALLDNVESPTGDTDAGAGINNARIVLKDRGPGATDDTCPVMVMFYDGGVDANVTANQVERLREFTSARVCVIQMVDPGANAAQQANRLEDIQVIVDLSASGELVAVGDYSVGIPAGAEGAIYDCIIGACPEYNP